MSRYSGRVVDVRAYLPTSTARPPASEWEVKELASPMSRFPGFLERPSFQSGLDLVIVEVELDDGTIGIGITSGGWPTAWLIANKLRPLLVGSSIHEHAGTWSKLYLSTVWYGRKGLPMHALSAIDLALWDARGRLRREPVWAMLGGTDPSLTLYATGPDFKLAADAGYFGAKLPLVHAPAAGEIGFQGNVEAIAEGRRVVGPDMPLMIDSWMSLDVDYAERLAWATSEYGLAWIEEPLLPDDYLGMAELKRRMRGSGVRLAAGEHEYGLAGYELMLALDCVDVLQPDPLWCGGLTELLKVDAIASEKGVSVVPHNASVYGYHFGVAALEPAGWPGKLGEFYMRPDHRPQPLFTGVLAGEPTPHMGRVTLSESPGFGVELSPELHLTRVEADSS